MIHARLRMLCSPLNDHLFSHIHVVDNPSCSCGHARENNKHFLFDCPLYINERQMMMQSLQQIGFEQSVHNLLYGDITYSVDKNTKAFIIIQRFIETSGRFD